MAYIKYIKYLLRHKWFVLRQCWQLGLYWRGLVHDLSKFRPDELFPYARHFYGERGGAQRDDTGYYKPTDTGDATFDMAWLRHQKRNDHHWQWWILPEDEGGVKILRMTDVALLEMVCDWRGASQAQGFGVDVTDWYLKNRGKMQLHPDTRAKIEDVLEIDWRVT